MILANRIIPDSAATVESSKCDISGGAGGTGWKNGGAGSDGFKRAIELYEYNKY